MSRLAIHGGTPVRTQPFPQWPQYDQREIQNLESVVRSGHWFAGMRGGEPWSRVAEFEKKFADLHGVRHAIANTNGTISIEIALRAAGIGPGDEVIIPCLTFIATASAVMIVGAQPIMVDVEPVHHCIDPALFEAAITPRTRAVIPVHFAGHICDMDVLLPIARKHNLTVIEDCAHAHGAVWKGARAGSLGHFGTFSFQESKTMTAGEGGIITTNDPDLAERCIELRSCGRRKGGTWYTHYVMPVNYRMVEFEAAVLLAQIERFPQQLAARQKGAAYLNARLEKLPGVSPVPTDARCEVHGYYLFNFRYDSAAFSGVSRNDFVAALEAEGFPCHIGYPFPLQRNPFFESYPEIRKLEFPVAERHCAETVVIPHQVLLAAEQDLDDVIRAISRIHEHAGQLRAASALSAD